MISIKFLECKMDPCADDCALPHDNRFAGRQLLDMIAPSNFILANPPVICRTVQEQGRNLVRGFHNLIDDALRAATGASPAGAHLRAD